MNLEINDASSLIICNPQAERQLKKSVPFTLLFPSKDGRLLKFRGSVAIVFAPFSRSFCLYLDTTILVNFLLKILGYFQSICWNKGRYRTFLFF